jgi:hypothetical protein
VATDNVETLYALGGLQSGGGRGIENENFVKVKLERLLIGPGTPPQSTVRVANCSFSDCSVVGEFRIAPGVELESVVFDNVTSPDLMTINTQTALRNVIVRGSSKLRGLWVKPADFADVERKRLCQDWSAAASDGVERMLDFSEFYGEEVEVVGLPLSKLRWNHEHHVPIFLDWIASEKWKQIGLPLTSYWSMRMKRLQAFNATAGVYSLPSPKNKKYAQTKEEMARLIDAGLLPRVTP